jgi:Leucine-rich repeat (LRR) protein
LLIVLNQSLAFDLKCNFTNYDFIWGPIEYTCQAQDLNIEERNFALTKIVGVYDEGKSAENVLQLLIDRQKVFYLPSGISNLFVNLKALLVMSSQMKKIQRQNFDGMQNLNALLINYNEIVEIPEDAFTDLTKLEYLSLSSNLIKTLNENVFRGLKNLKRLHLHDNELVKLSGKLFQDNVNLEVIWLQGNKLKYIGADIFSYVSGVREVFLGSNKCIHLWFPANGVTMEAIVERISEYCQEPIDERLVD